MSYSFSVGPPISADHEFASPDYKKIRNKTPHKTNNQTPTSASKETQNSYRDRHNSQPDVYKDAKHGKIKLICGPMFSGKSSELLRQMKVFEIANHKTLLIKYSKDNRYSDKPEVSTHDKVMRKAVSCGKILSIIHKIALDFSVIGIDEGQFFEDLVKFAHDMANRGKTVLVAALDGDFKQDPFPQVAKLFPKAESILKLTSVCMACLREATFSRRFDADDKRVEVIGDSDDYAACCRRCLLINSEEFRKNVDIRKNYRAKNNTDDLYHRANEITKNSSEESLPSVENAHMENGDIHENGQIQNGHAEDYKNSLLNGNSTPENDENMQIDNNVLQKRRNSGVKRKIFEV